MISIWVGKSLLQVTYIKGEKIVPWKYHILSFIDQSKLHTTDIWYSTLYYLTYQSLTYQFCLVNFSLLIALKLLMHGTFYPLRDVVIHTKQGLLSHLWPTATNRTGKELMLQSFNVSCTIAHGINYKTLVYMIMSYYENKFILISVFFLLIILTSMSLVLSSSLYPLIILYCFL